MNSIKTQLSGIFTSAIYKAFGIEIDPVIQPAGRPEFGDYQANFALRLTKQLQLKPIEIANKIIDIIKHELIFESLEASGPGFINIVIKNSFLNQHLNAIAKDSRLGIPQQNNKQTIVIDYGGANVAKEMHIGHLRSTIIGDAIVRLLEYTGNNIIRQNHLGDWGTQFGMLIEHLVDHQWNPHANHSYSDLNKLYKESKARFDADNDFAARAKKRVVLLQSGDKESLAIWENLVTESKHHFQLTYDKLNVLLTEEDARGESFYNDMLAPLTQELEKNKIAIRDEGALVIPLEGFLDPDGKEIPFLIRKKDSGYLYATTDLAAIKYRVEKLHANRIIYVVDARQKQHFSMLFSAIKKTNWSTEKLSLEHVAYGSVLGEDHKPFKTRSGESIKLNDVLEEAQNRAQQLVLQKHPDLETNNLIDIAKKVGIGALKYADLRNDKIKDYVFSWEKMLAFDGNTAPYLQNAYVRIISIFRKGEISRDTIQSFSIQIDTPIEHALAIKISAFSDVIISISENLHLHVLCEYLYDLASIFHRFYESCPVLIEPNESIRYSRLLFCDLTARVLKQGLYLLGIETVERM